MTQMQAAGLAPATPPPPVSMTLKSLSELREHVGTNNEKINSHIMMLTDIANALHGDGPPSQDNPDEAPPSGALGHVTFNLTEQGRLLEILANVIARI